MLRRFLGPLPSPLTLMNTLQQHILKTLLYYDIFSYPLRPSEIFTFLTVNSVRLEDVEQGLLELKRRNLVDSQDDHYFLKHRDKNVVQRRKMMEGRARKAWKNARLMTSIMRRFPFVRAVLVSGDLSKNIAGEESDIDYFVITRPNRLWISRSLLVLFKKVFLLNRRKFFCINYFLAEDTLEVRERDIYVATEIAHLKPLYNARLYREFMRRNVWIKEYFPNFSDSRNGSWSVDDRKSFMQKVLELPFIFDYAHRVDRWLMRTMEKLWEKRYPMLSDDDRRRLFRCSPHVSTAHGGDFQRHVLKEYRERLSAYNLSESSSTKRFDPFPKATTSRPGQ